MRTPLVAGNWKMHTTVGEARDLACSLVASLDHISGVEKVLCPPHVSLTAVAEAIADSSLKLGAQNMHDEPKGAFTGEVSPSMLAGLCEYVILGHSERRHVFGEQDDFINRKVKAAVDAGLRSVLCVGETLDERDSGQADQVIVRQLTLGLEGVATRSGLVIAYEPVWAIGTGRPATAADANAAVSLIRRTLHSLVGPDAANNTRILYGGSVNSRNAAELMAQPEIDGALVGGASLKAADFTQIVARASEAKKE